MPTTASLRLFTRFTSRSMSTAASRSRSAVKYSPAASCDYVHLLENENGYGIAKPYHKNGFQKEYYHNKLHPAHVEQAKKAGHNHMKL